MFDKNCRENSVEERLTSLEKQNKNLRLITLAVTCFFVFSVVILFGCEPLYQGVSADQKEIKVETIEAQNIILRDDEGIIRADLSIIGEDYTRLRMFDGNGEFRLGFGVDNEVANIVFRNEDTNMLLSNADDFASLTISDNDMNPFFSIFGSLDAGGELNIFNEYGDNRVAIFQTTESHGGIWIYDKYGDDSKSYGHR